VIVPFGLFVPQPPASGGPGGPGAGGGTPNPYPEGFQLAPAPFGVSFTGMACSEPRLIELAYAFEQATKKRVPPPHFK
jgi:amidase